MTLVLAGVALLVLSALDYLIIIAALLGESEVKQLAIPAAMLIGLGLAFAFRQRWLVYAVQSVIPLITLYSGLRYQTEPNAKDGAMALALVIGGYALAWLIARAIPSVSGLA